MGTESGRVRVAIATDPDVSGPARVTSLADLGELLEDLWKFGPEPEGVVVEIDAAALDELADRWTWKRLDREDGYERRKP